MEDKLIMFNILTLQKNLIEILIHSVIESNNKNINNLLKDQLNDNLDMHNKVFKFMEEQGWYNIPDASEHKIQATVSKLQSN